jgi:hypothetical protein
VFDQNAPALISGLPKGERRRGARLAGQSRRSARTPVPAGKDFPAIWPVSFIRSSRRDGMRPVQGDIGDGADDEFASAIQSFW